MRTQKNHPRLFGTGPGWVALLCLAVLAWTGIATAQLPSPGQPWQFDVTGFLQEATVTNAGDAHSGGSLKVNGHVVTVPSDTIVILPANQLTWQEVFAQAPAPYTGVATGMAALDLPVPLTKYEVHVIGNVLPGPGCSILNCSGTYVAGLISIAQQGLNSGAGYINFINYATGEIRVGGTPGSSADGTRVQLNDPTGKFGRAMTPDQRFTLDPDNPTVRSVTGFPMCLPRSDPAGATPDAACPETQRPLCIVAGAPAATPCGFFTTIDPATAGSPSAFITAPFEVGDYVSFSGTLVKDCVLLGCAGSGPTAGPWPALGTAATYISAHTINNNIGIYTFPGTNPAYVATDVTLIGTGGNTVLGIGEATIRTRFEGFTSDPSRMVHLYGLDLACDGTISGERDWGIIGIDPGAPTGAVKGRWRFRPPCAVFGTDPATIKFDKQCIMNAAGTFLPPTREVRAVLEALPGTAQIPAWTASAPTCVPPQVSTLALPCNTVTAGLTTGQYHAPITDYLFPEQVVGNPVPPANFDTLQFLANGGYVSTAGTLTGQITPFPFVPAPAPACAVQPPTVTASASPLTVASGGTVNLTATATGSGTITFAWSQTAGTAGTFTPTPPNAALVTWTAPTVAANETATFSVVASNGGGASTPATVNVTVTPTTPVVTSATATPNPAVSGTTVTLSAAATGATPMTFTWAQTAGPTVILTTVNPPGDGSIVTFPAPAVGANTPLSFTVQATNVAGASALVTVNVTISPPNVPVITSATASPSPAVSNSTVTLSAAATGAAPITFQWVQTVGPAVTFNPAGGNAASVTFTAPLVAVATPLTFQVTASNIGGASAPATVNVTINPPAAPIVQHVTPLTATSGVPVTMNVTATSTNVLANLTLQVTQTTAFTLTGFTTTKTGQTCTATLCTGTWTVTFTRTLPAGQLTNDVIQFTITASDTSVTPNLVSAPEFTTVTVKPTVDTITATGEYRTGKQRLIINATSSVVSPTVVLKLQPYLTTSGTIFTPTAAQATLTNNGGGLYILTLVGAPRPACRLPLNGTFATPCTQTPLDVKSSLGGDSGPFALTRIRQ